METQNESFSFTYSANEQEEIKRIRQKYLPKEDKMEQLRRLDASVTKKASIVSIVIGVIGVLIMGTGMSLTMTNLGKYLGLQGSSLVIGVIIGMIGIVLVCCAYPVYNRIVLKEREKIAPEILRLTDELMK